MSKKISFDSVKTFYKDVAESAKIPDGAQVERKSIDVALSTDESSGLISATFSTPSTDRDGDIVWPMGCVSDFYSGTVCWNHSLSDPPIGRCDIFSVSEKGLVGKIKLSDTYAFARDIFGLVKEGILRGISIGFIPLSEVLRGTKAFSDFVAANGLAGSVTSETNRIITKWEWIEVSICPIGSNRDALISGVASKSLAFSDAKTISEFGLDRPETKNLIDLESKKLDAEKRAEEAEKALHDLEKKAATTAPATVANPAELSVSAFLRVLKGQESELTSKLNQVWQDAAEQVAKIDVANAPLDDVAASLSNALDDAAGKADALTRAQVQAIADQVFSGYTTGYDGVTPIKDIAKIDEWKRQFVADYMASLQPDNSKPLQAQTIDSFKNDFLRATQGEETLPVLDMSASNETTGTLSTFGAQRNILADLMSEAGSGDICQIKGIDDEKLCDACKPWLDSFVSISGNSDKFPSLQSVKDSGWSHPNCRCVIVPTIPPKSEEKKIEAAKIETKAVRIERKGYVLSEQEKQELVAFKRGKLV